MKRLCAALLAWPLLAQAYPVTDDSGRTFDLAAAPTRIAEGWYAHQVLLLTLGAGDRIAVTVNQAREHPWMYRVQPGQQEARQIQGRTFNIEQLLADRVQLVFLSGADRQGEALEQAGISVMHMGFDSFDGLKDSLDRTAQALGSPQAVQRAADYRRYLDQMQARVAKATEGLAQAQRPRVLHLASLNPLKADGDGTLIDQWIALAGGRNAAQGLHGNLQQVSAEQVLAWNPDVIIVAASAAGTQPDWLKLTAAGRAGRIVRNPEGVFPWERYGTEVALQLPWAAQLLHPDRFVGQDMAALTMDFYHRFFNYPLSRDQALAILHVP